MAGPIGQKQQQQEFALVSVSELSSSSSASPSEPAVARFCSDSGVAELRIHKEPKSTATKNVNLKISQVSFCFLK